ncbi:unnamed protein product [Rotaria sp. Silwood2]|nr:unnamed protein product [Rotaria sp. Silwood2]CAF2877567.1 unnamed protein product [Rotaria sp. Silwood2]CAF3359806.1 unnamed protein product [Rotaria sp. Silwood2]CAF4000501.1 unnamed protein product [Rotaria sp. Silwood2]CAF4000594.1 unnamed protein product [Rotaria sp. Silwood2]
MTTKTNQKRIREVLMTNIANDYHKNTCKDDDWYSDLDYSVCELEFDDTSTDKNISKEDDSSDFNISDDDIHINIQPKSMEQDKSKQKQLKHFLRDVDCIMFYSL